MQPVQPVYSRSLLQPLADRHEAASKVQSRNLPVSNKRIYTCLNLAETPPKVVFIVMCLIFSYLVHEPPYLLQCRHLLPAHNMVATKRAYRAPFAFDRPPQHSVAILWPFSLRHTLTGSGRYNIAIYRLDLIRCHEGSEVLSN